MLCRFLEFISNLIKHEQLKEDAGKLRAFYTQLCSVTSTHNEKEKKDHLFKETMTELLRKVELTHCKCV